MAAPRYAALNPGELHASETVSQVDRNYPGAAVNTLHYLEQGGADGAAKSCWGDSGGTFTCDDASVDGLLTSDFRPRATWWARSAGRGRGGGVRPRAARRCA